MSHCPGKTNIRFCVTLLINLAYLVVPPCIAQSTSGVDSYNIDAYAGESGISAKDGEGVLASIAHLGSPQGMFVDANSNLYVSDSLAYTVRKIDANTIISTVAGTRIQGYSGDGGPATSAQLYQPVSQWVDNTNVVMILDLQYATVRSVTNGMISFTAGAGGNGNTNYGDGGPPTSATFSTPKGIYGDNVGNVYISDSGHQKVRMFSSGVVSTFAGNGNVATGTDNIPATASAIYDPYGIVVDPTRGNVYFCEQLSHVVRKVDFFTGLISTLAGTSGISSYSTDVLAVNAYLDHPTGLFLDSTGKLFITEINNRRIRMIVNGYIYTIAGTGSNSISGNGGAATAASFRQMYNIAGDTTGLLFAADTYDYTIRKLYVSTPTLQPTTFNPTLCPSVKPSTKPSCIPTISPTIAPSCTPTIAPSCTPTVVPTCGPTLSPSVLPTLVPTVIPTVFPSQIPTTIAPTTTKPTVSPTRTPTAWPTSQPSSRPSVQPSCQPSSQPSRQPSAQPTMQPSQQPSARPTSQPSARPSRQPSRRPTSQPSSRPTSQPSSKPSTQPSSRPSTQPSSHPTGQPSRQPSTQPTAQPSFQPSVQPSVRPTEQPSTQPSSQPSSRPTTQPTSQPFGRPSRQPSARPSSQPFSKPTGQPTSQPSVQPSTRPSGQPTMQPSSQPLSNPSVQPSHQPSALPTVQPSEQPSSQPSGQPSKQPSARPSRQPFSRPSAQPSRLPTCQPTSQPTGQPSKQPNNRPSVQPSSGPSEQPSSRPSSQPSVLPSQQPSGRPTLQPSGQPSTVPTLQPAGCPSSEPSVQPSKVPSAQPTGCPSEQPSSQPSRQPMSSPTSTPSVQPSREPTARPSSVPTMQPSDCPSMQPSGHPSSQPSGLPSAQPTRVPTSFPSSQPTSVPSSKPSIQPSARPSRQPSDQPSEQPSRQPAAAPSGLPTSQPTDKPSARPSSQPTELPSAQPYVHPTSFPTSQPTSRPSRQPQSRPTSQPSIQPTAHPSGQPSRQPSSQPSAVPTTAAFLALAPKSTVPTGTKISVVGANDLTAFKIVLPFNQVSPGSGAALSNIIVSSGLSGTNFIVSGDANYSATTVVTGGNFAYFLNGFGSDGNKRRSVGVLKDFNADGYADLIIGDPFEARCYVMLGNEHGFTNMSDGFTIFGEQNSDMTGWSVADAGDVNNDTVHDIIIGAPSAHNTGAFYVLYGGKNRFVDIYLNNVTVSHGFIVYGNSQSDYLGLSVSGAGDVNKDGYGDVVVGASSVIAYNSGGVYVMYGGVGLTSIPAISQLSSDRGFKIMGDAFCQVGYSVSAAGDVNKDGFDDVLIGSYPSKTTLVQSAYLVYGAESPSSLVLSSLSATEGVVFIGGGMLVSSDTSSSSLIIGSGVDLSGGGGVIVNLDLTAAVIESPRPTPRPTIAPTQRTAHPSHTKCPTFMPTSRSPSALPSAKPTTPTLMPTFGPTSPTSVPSSAPSVPTYEPSTVSPTEVPSERPTEWPSSRPSSYSYTPSTIIPSEAPSEMPIVLTRKPSFRKTATPTAYTRVTRDPTRAPTAVPTVSMQPTVRSSGILYTYVMVNTTHAQMNPVWRRKSYNIHFYVNSTVNISIVDTGGIDKFTIVPNPGTSLTVDFFNVTADLIDLSLFYPSIAVFGQLTIRAGSAIVVLPRGQTVRLVNIGPTDLSARHFIFGVDNSNSSSDSVNPAIIYASIVIAAVILATIAVFFFVRVQRGKEIIDDFAAWRHLEGFDTIKGRLLYLQFENHVNDIESGVSETEIDKELMMLLSEPQPSSSSDGRSVVHSNYFAGPVDLGRHSTPLLKAWSESAVFPSADTVPEAANTTSPWPVISCAVNPEVVQREDAPERPRLLVVKDVEQTEMMSVQSFPSLPSYPSVVFSDSNDSDRNSVAPVQRAETPEDSINMSDWSVNTGGSVTLYKVTSKPIDADLDESGLSNFTVDCESSVGSSNISHLSFNSNGSFKIRKPVRGSRNVQTTTAVINETDAVMPVRIFDTISKEMDVENDSVNVSDDAEDDSDADAKESSDESSLSDDRK